MCSLINSNGFKIVADVTLGDAKGYRGATSEVNAQSSPALSSRKEGGSYSPLLLLHGSGSTGIRTSQAVPMQTSRARECIFFED